jgi:hypothetical protein
MRYKGVALLDSLASSLRNSHSPQPYEAFLLPHPFNSHSLSANPPNQTRCYGMGRGWVVFLGSRGGPLDANGRLTWLLGGDPWEAASRSLIGWRSSFVLIARSDRYGMYRNEISNMRDTEIMLWAYIIKKSILLAAPKMSFKTSSAYYLGSKT